MTHLAHELAQEFRPVIEPILAAIDRLVDDTLGLPLVRQPPV